MVSGSWVDSGCRAADLAGGGGFMAKAFDVHLDNDCMMDEAMNRGDGHHWVWEHIASLDRGLVGGDQQFAAFLSPADQLEQDGDLGLIPTEAGELVKHLQVVAIGLGNGRRASGK